MSAVFSQRKDGAATFGLPFAHELFSFAEASLERVNRHNPLENQLTAPVRNMDKPVFNPELRRFATEHNILIEHSFRPSPPEQARMGVLSLQHSEHKLGSNTGVGI